MFLLTHSSTDIVWEGEGSSFLGFHQDAVTEETLDVLQKTSQQSAGHTYQLGETSEPQSDLHNMLTDGTEASCGFVLHKLTMCHNEDEQLESRSMADSERGQQVGTF